MRNERYIYARTQAYAQNFETRSEYQTLGKVNIGDGQVGNGIIKDGKLHLREEDIEKIVSENLPVYGGKNKFNAVKEGGGEQPLSLFVGDNNKVNKDGSDEEKAFYKKTAHSFNNEMGTSPLELPSPDDYEVVDFEPGEADTWDEPGYGASGSISVGDADAPDYLFRVAYEKASGLEVDRESIRKLALRLKIRGDEIARDYEEDKSLDFDWEEYQRDRD